ncbi:glycosyltransferase [Ideonella sp.]|uniref:glycosyltransferase n=1 Tax=Ideonella sp. TaxID=1929293 RepID=UPI0035B123E2
MLRRLWSRWSARAPWRGGAARRLAAAREGMRQGRVDEAMAAAGAVVGVGGRLDGRAWSELCRIAHEAGRPDQAAAWADAWVAQGSAVGDADRRLIDELRRRREVLQRLRQPRVGRPVSAPEPGRVLNLLAYSLPYTSNGYATRSHGLLTALQAAGWDVRPATRPGYPGDADRAHKGSDLPPMDRVGRLDYRRLLASSRRRLGHTPYLLAAADEIGELVRVLRPGLVHAASNYMTALPAAIAAREAGLPFVYEVRGFWDVTRASSDPGFMHTAECRQLRAFERELLQVADALVTLTGPMAEELVRRGAPADRIRVAPNAVDGQLSPRPRRAALARQLGMPDGVPVIGYIGSFVDYEGLDDLVAACALLRDRGLAFHLLLVGDGLARDAVLAQVQAAGLQDRTCAVGRIPHDDVADHYALVDLCPFPRKPWPVCELVSPLKPLEAMALGKCVLVSSVAAMADMVREGDTGVVVPKGDVVAWATALEARLRAGDAAAFGARARAWVRGHRTWSLAAAQVADAYTFALQQCIADLTRVNLGGRGILRF